MKILIVEPESSGHHAFYLRLILRAFAEHECWLLTSPAPADLENLVAAQPDPAVRRVEIDDGRPGPTVAAAVELHQHEGFDVVFFPFIDQMLPFLARGAGRQLGRVAGIWMRATALDPHYRYLPPIDKKAKARGYIHRWLRQPTTAEYVRDLIFLVQRDADQLARVAPGIRGHVVDDPPESVSSLTQAEARRKLGLPAEGCILLHPGSPERRKGFTALLRAYRCVEARGRPTPFLLRVGPNKLKGPERQQLDRMVRVGCAQATEKYVPAEELADAYAACDWVAMPYRKFRQSSGILVNAEAAGRPVLATDYGHIAAQVRASQAGMLVKHDSVQALAQALPRLTPLSPAAFKPPAGLVEAKQQAFADMLSVWLKLTAAELTP